MRWSPVLGLFGQLNFVIFCLGICLLEGCSNVISQRTFAKIAMLMIRIITVPFSLHFISLLNQILLFDRAAADEMTEVSFAFWKHLVNTTIGNQTS